MLVWRDALHHIDDYWLTGSGLNTFAISISHTLPWSLPKGAEPWPNEIQQSVAAGRRPVIRIPEGMNGQFWYREAHNDYIQILVETGLPGLALALGLSPGCSGSWGANRWLWMGAAAVLLHEFVDFDLQIPAIAVLLVVVGAAGREAAPSDVDS